MKVRKIFQKYFKEFFIKIFFLIYGRIVPLYEYDNHDYKITKIKKIILDDNTHYDLPNCIYEIFNGRIYTDFVEHVAIIKKNKILRNISYQQIKGELKDVEFNKAVYSGTPRFIKYFDGTMLSLVQGASGNNYFHFLFDVVTKLKLCSQIIPLDKIDFFYVPGKLHWQIKILNLFGIHEKKLIDSHIYRHVKAKNIIAVDHPWYQKGNVQDEIVNLPTWSILWLREKFLKYSKKFQCANKIFIDRSDSKFNHCKLVNNDEVMEYLLSQGYKSYKVGELDFFEQIYLFSSAKIIIGPHGAAFTNIIFSKSGTNIVEIIPEDHPSKKCERISKILNLKYKRMNQARIFNREGSGDMLVKIDALHKILQQI